MAHSEQRMRTKYFHGRGLVTVTVYDTDHGFVELRANHRGYTACSYSFSLRSKVDREILMIHLDNLVSRPDSGTLTDKMARVYALGQRSDNLDSFLRTFPTL
jgi:hypothetical protein